jgi:hypothetical protein
MTYVLTYGIFTTGIKACLFGIINSITLIASTGKEYNIKVAGGNEVVQTSLYNYLTETVKNVPSGAGDVIFTPWLH